MAITAQIIDGAGNATGEGDLPQGLFGGEVNAAILHQVVVAQLAAARAGTASTRTRSEVRGGGRKPWRQKGTGRARHGSVRSPIWVGGGTVFGPKPRDYSQRINKKMRRAALRSALADKAQAKKVFVLDGFTETKTKAAAKVLRTAGIGGKVLFVLTREDEASVTIDRAFRNLANSAFALEGSLAAYDVLAADAVVFTPAALDVLTRRAEGNEGVNA